MKLEEYIKHNKLKIKDVERGLKLMFGGGPSIVAITHIIKGKATPSLETALMISRWSNFKVEPYELIVERRYTKVDDKIYVMFPKSVKTDDGLDKLLDTL